MDDELWEFGWEIFIKHEFPAFKTTALVSLIEFTA